MVELIKKIELEEHEGQVYHISDYFEIHSILGKGGYGTVVHAFDKLKNENIAIKVLFKQISNVCPNSW